MATGLVLAIGLLLGMSPAASPEGERDYFPLNPSRTWSYEYSKKRAVFSEVGNSFETKAGTVVDTVLRTSAEFEFADPVFVLERRLSETDLASKNKTEVRSELHYSAGDQGILLHGQKLTGIAGHSAALIPFDPPQLILKLPIEAMPEGAARSHPRSVIQGQARPKSQSFETVRVRAGTFERCLKIESEGEISGKLPGGFEIKSGIITKTAWFAAGIGMVKSVEMRKVKFRLAGEGSGNSVEVTEQELVSYSKGE